MNHLKTIFTRLNLNRENGLILKGEDLEIYPSRIRISLSQINYDAIYNYVGKPIIIFKEYKLIEHDIEEEIL